MPSTSSSGYLQPLHLPECTNYSSSATASESQQSWEGQLARAHNPAAFALPAPLVGGIFHPKAFLR